jgi:hypothetical protein
MRVPYAVLATARAGRIYRERPIAIEVLIAAGSLGDVSLVLLKLLDL